jgi:hypothetical protein
MHATPSVRREVVPASRSSNASISTSGISTSGPVTTTTYKISSDPLKRGSSVREDSRRRGNTLDNSTRPLVTPIVTSGHRHSHRPVVHITSARPSSPLQDPYRSSQEDYYAVPASSKHHHHRPKRYSTTVDNADINRLARERDTSQSSRLRVAPREGPTYTSNRNRPSYTKPVVRDTADYGDDGYGYTTPRDLVAYDLNNTPTAPPRHHSRHHSTDRTRPTSIASFADVAPGSYARDRPPVTTRQFDRIPAARPVAPVEYERPEVRPPPPMDPIRPVRVEVPPEAPRRKDSVSRRPVSYYHDREKRPSGRDDYYEVRDDERGYRSERHRHHRDDDVVEQRGYSRTDREPTRSEVRSERPEPVRVEPARIEPVRERHDSRVEPVRERHEQRAEPPREHKHEEEHKDHKGRDAAIAGLSLAGAALGVKAFKDTADHDDDEPRKRRDYDDEPRRRRDPRDERDTIDLSGRDPKERRHRDESPRPRHRDESPPRDRPRHRDESPKPRDRDLSPPREKAPEVLDLSGRNPKERHNSRDERDSDPERREIRRLRSEAPPVNGTAIETESSASDETVPRRRRKASTAGGAAFNPRDTMDLYALKEALKDKEAPPPPPPTSTRTPRESMSKDGRELVEVRSGLEGERGVRIVTPPPVAGETKAPVKGILRAPREKFPEDPAPIREGVAPLKDAKKDGVPPDARWTKISRKLVNPEALEAGKERYEAREDFVIVLRVLSRDEVQGYAEVTERIRGSFPSFPIPPIPPY